MTSTAAESASNESPTSAAFALRAGGLLGEFNRAGVLNAADVHVARRLQRLCGEPNERVALAAALAVRAVRHGSVVLDLREVATQVTSDGPTAEESAALGWPEIGGWFAAVQQSPLVSSGPEASSDRPLRLVGELLYLDRYWRQEQEVAGYVDAAMLASPTRLDEERLDAALQRLFPSREADRQRLAGYVAAHRRLSVVAGGPGTGKTTTVARLLGVLQDLADGELRIALAAPTAKAAARITEAAASEIASFSPADRERLAGLTASTLHRLLGSRRAERTRFRYNRDNRLPYDVVVVDEASMVSLTMMSRLVEALRPTCRLILVGDPNQLSSIEVGAVLGDLVQRAAPPDAVPLAVESAQVRHDLQELSADEQQAALAVGVVGLTQVHRFGGRIQALAEAIRCGEGEQVLALLAAGHREIEFLDGDPASRDVPLESLRTDVVDAGRAVIAAARAGHAAQALAAMGRHRVLCAHREGPYGVAHWSEQVQHWLSEAVEGYAADGLWYLGRPLLVTSNDYSLRLFNGDTGVVVDHGGQPRAAFLRDGVLELLTPSRLADVTTVHAMSIHRSQGSQFERVSVVLPPADSPLATRELLYTAVTRATDLVRIVGTSAAVTAAVRRPIVRASGLRSRRST